MALERPGRIREAAPGGEFRRWYVSAMDGDERDKLLDEAQEYNLRAMRQGLEGSVTLITLDRIRGVLRGTGRPPTRERNRR